MCGFASDFDRAVAGYSPDRVDALCFALTELLGGASFSGWVEFYRQEAERAIGPKPKSRPSQLMPAPIEAVALKAKPYAAFYVGTRNYKADAAGVISDVDRNHVEALRRSGCAQRKA